MNQTDDKKPNTNGCTCKLYKTMRYLWDINRLCDVCFLVDDKYQYYCHKLVIITYCPPFRLYLVNTRPKDLAEIKLSYSTKRGMSILINYIYSIYLNIDTSNFADILITSYELGIEKVSDKCETFINENIGERFLNEKEIRKLVLALPVLYPLKEKDFYKRIMKKVSENFNIVLRNDEFLSLNVKILHNLLKYYPITINKEIDLLNGVYKWVKTDKAKRSKYEKLLVDCIKFQYINPEDIEKHVESKDNIMNDPYMKEKVKLSLKFVFKSFLILGSCLKIMKTYDKSFDLFQITLIF